MPKTVYKEWKCYTIASETRTYVGKTNDLRRRLRQHNGAIKGGAKYTRTTGPWNCLFYVDGFDSNSTALKFEWRLHNPPGTSRRNRRGRSKYRGVPGRFRALLSVLRLQRWTRASPLAVTMPLRIVYDATRVGTYIDAIRRKLPGHVTLEAAQNSVEILERA